MRIVDLFRRSKGKQLLMRFAVFPVTAFPGHMGFGFVVVKFSLFVKQFSMAMAGHQVVASTGFSGVVGICLVGVGAGAALVGYWRYKRTEKQLLDQAFVQRSGWLLAFSVGVIAASLLLLYYLLPNL